MNVVDTKNWYARINKMPSTTGPTFMISGTVIVTNSATEATLMLDPVQDKSFGLRLLLVLEDKGIGLTVLTEKSVALTLPGYANVSHVQIFHDGKELVQIDEVEIVQ
ncbi:hypothetical protein ACCD10_02495 [Pseudomonas sp. Pseusp122]|jgi:hypothetical protein|uniref:hypothetical protein n=1 Tax=unclassified Pseudomonas TaxID=196821 RepID=UPI0039A417CF